MDEKIKQVKISTVIPNEDNPRYIRDEKFEQLVKSIKDFPEMLTARPIVVDENMVVLGGNMRLKACISAGLKTVPIMQMMGWTEQQKKEFIIKDNVGFGEWDWDILANTYDNTLLIEWGMDVWSGTGDDVQLDDFFEDKENKKVNKNQIILDFTDEDFATITKALTKLTGTKEEIFYNCIVKQ